MIHFTPSNTYRKEKRMKQKYVVYKDNMYDEARGKVVPKAIKTFKHEPEAKAFVNDPRNQRRYGQLYVLDTTSEVINDESM